MKNIFIALLLLLAFSCTTTGFPDPDADTKGAVSFPSDIAEGSGVFQITMSSLDRDFTEVVELSSSETLTSRFLDLGNYKIAKIDFISDSKTENITMPSYMPNISVTKGSMYIYAYKFVATDSNSEKKLEWITDSDKKNYTEQLSTVKNSDLWDIHF